MGQNIDISGIPDVAGKTATFSAWFNRVAGDSQTDDKFCVRIRAYNDSNAELGLVTGCINTDSDIHTWEQASTTLSIPHGTTRLKIRLSASENVFNDGSDPEFDGHYADDAVLFIPMDEGEFWYYIIGRPTIRGGFPTEFYLHYGNDGSATIDKAAILLTTTSNTTMSHSVPGAWNIS